MSPSGKLHVLIELKMMAPEETPQLEFKERAGGPHRRGAMRRRVHQVSFCLCRLDLT